MIPLLAASWWLAAWVVTARQVYIRIRPAREPIWCEELKSCGRGRHVPGCYQRGSTDEAEARFYALFAGLFWPLALPVLLVAVAAFRNPPLLDGEGRARIARLERELGYRDE